STDPVLTTPLSAQSTSGDAAPDAPEAGETIAGYRIEGELGRGGMGVVYRARQPGLNRLVALKMILHAGPSGSAERQRFQAEAEGLARLRHDNIVHVYEIGEHDGKPFLSLEYVEGGSLDRLLKTAPLPPRPAAVLTATLAAAMQVAHEAGIIRRDLKPANVLLQEARGKRQEASDKPEEAASFLLPLSSCLLSLFPKITDFGLAKKLDDESGQTKTGAIVGTPSYMAPEQAEGKGKSLGPACDVYALGAILYECLTGRPPFRAA